MQTLYPPAATQIEYDLREKQPASPKRIVYLDNLRIVLVLLVIIHHAIQPYKQSGEWFVHDRSRAAWIGWYLYAESSVMALFFMISGYFAASSLSRKSVGHYLLERSQKLGIPLIAITILVFLPYNYIRDGAQGNIFSYFVHLYLERPGDTIYHLWFLSMLLCFSFMYALLRVFFNRPTRASGKTDLSSFHILGFALILTVATALIKRRYSEGYWTAFIIPVEPAHLPQYIMMFVAGIILYNRKWLDRIRVRVWLFVIFLSAAMVIAAPYLDYGSWRSWPYFLRPFVLYGLKVKWELAEAFGCVGFTLAMILLFRKYLNYSNAWMQRLSANAFGAYLFHLFFLVPVQYALLPYALGAGAKFLISTVTGVILTFWGTNLMRRVPIIRKYS